MEILTEQKIKQANKVSREEFIDGPQTVSALNRLH